MTCCSDSQLRLPRHLLRLDRRRYFYATLQLGTPAKSFEVIVDTGSTITYVPCSQCGDQCGSHHAVRTQLVSYHHFRILQICSVLMDGV